MLPAVCLWRNSAMNWRRRDKFESGFPSTTAVLEFYLKEMKVFLLKDYSKEYERAIVDQGYQVDFKPALSSHSVNLKKSREVFKVSPSTNGYDALVVTSQNALRSIENENILKNIHEDWFQVPMFCVGPATQALGKSLGFQKCRGQECGNANALASSIISQRHQVNPFPSSFLFLTGDKTKATISESLISAGFRIEPLQVYETRNQEINLLDLIGSTVVLFSPSGITSLGKNMEAITAANINWISIGPSTFKALFDIGIQSVQAESPTPDGVVNALLKLSKL